MTIGTMSSVQNEIQARYPQANNGEKQFLTTLFYFIRGIFLLLGVLILLFSSHRKDVLAKDVVEVSGKISTIEVYGGKSSSLKIVLANNSNEYETRTFKIPSKNLEQIENELSPGNFVYLLIEQGDKDKVNNPDIQIYGIKTKRKINNKRKEAFDLLLLIESTIVNMKSCIFV